MMERGKAKKGILTVNAGSSSLKFALFDSDDLATKQLSGKFESIGLPEAKLTTKDSGAKAHEVRLALPDHAACLPQLLSILNETGITIEAIAHRVVHGGPNYYEPRVIDGNVIAELKGI